MTMNREEKLEMEIIPMGNQIYVQPYAENPYREKVTEGGVIVPDGEFFNPDSGMLDRVPEVLKCGQVMEVGPACKYIKPGDDVFYHVGQVFPIPFMGKGFLMTAETAIYGIIGKNLKERFNG